METLSASLTLYEKESIPKHQISKLLGLYEANGFPHKGPVMYSFDVSFIVGLNKLLNKESTCRYFEARGCYETSL